MSSETEELAESESDLTAPQTGGLLYLLNGNQLGYLPTSVVPTSTEEDPWSSYISPLVLSGQPPQMFLMENGQVAISNGLQVLVGPLDYLGLNKSEGEEEEEEEEETNPQLYPLLLGQGGQALNLQHLSEDLITDQIEDGGLMEEEDDDEEEGVALTELADVVVSFKCRMCQHLAPSRPQLLLHLAEHHQLTTATNTEDEELEEEEQPESSNLELIDEARSEVSEELQSELSEDAGGDDDPDVRDKFVFLCAQCAEAFDSLEACKTHMVEDHRLVTEEQDRMARVAAVPVPPVPLPSAPLPSPVSPLSPPAPPPTRSPSPPVTDQGCSPIPPAAEEPSGSERASSGQQQQPTSQVVVGAEQRPERTKRKTTLPKDLQKNYVVDIKGKALFKCSAEGCGVKFKSSDELNVHRSCHNPKEKTFRCCRCRQHFRQWKPCAMHLWQQHQVAVGMLTCSQCDHKTNSTTRLANHVRIHSEDRNFVCKVCNKTFKQRGQLSNHSVLHVTANRTSHESRWYMAKECHVCHKTLADTKCLKKHFLAVHGKVRPYSCSVCGHTSARKAMMQLHLRQHTGEKPYACDVCSFQTGDHNSLRRHKMRHSGVKPYRCPHCSYSCIQSSAYKSHLRKKHPDGQAGAFKCSECTFLCVSESAYLDHVEQHRQQEKAQQSLAKLQDRVFPGGAASLVLRLGSQAGGLLKAPAPRAERAEGEVQTVTIRVAQQDDVDDGCIRVEDLVEQRGVDEPDLGGITIPADPPCEASCL